MRDLNSYSKEELINEVKKLQQKVSIKNKKTKEDTDCSKKQKKVANKWEEIFNAISSFLFLIDTNNCIILCNKAARKYLKLTKEKIINRNFWELLFETSEIPEEINIHSARRQSKEIKIKNKWFKITIQPFLDENATIFEYSIIVTDITERKNYTQEIEERRDKFADLVELANVAIASDDKVGNLVYFNKQFADLFGYTSEEIKNLSHDELIHPDDRKLVKEIHNLRFTKKKPISRYEFKGVKKDGSTVYIDISVSDIIKFGGKVTGTRSYLRDITEKKYNEWKINEQVKKIKCLHNIANLSSQKNISLEKYLNEVILYLPGAFQEPENIACAVYYKSKVFKTYNYKESKKSIQLTLKLKRKIVGKIIVNYLGDRSQNVFSSEEKDLVTIVSYKIGDFLEYAHSEVIKKVQFNIANAVSTSENIEQFISVIRNELGQLIDTKNFFIAFYDKLTKMCTCPYMDDEKDTLNTWLADKSMTGYLIRQEKPVLLKKKDYLKLSLQGEFDIIGSLAEVWLGVPLKIKNEIIGAFVVQSYTNPNAYDEDDLEMLEFVSHQISISIERKKAIDELESALEKAQESDRLKSAFLTNISHEIRTPMNGILGFTKLLAKDDIDNDRRKKYLEIIDKNSKQLLSIIGDILDISKIETGQLEAFNQRLLLYDFITEIYDFYKPGFDKNKIDFSLKLNFSDKILEIITDEGKLNQIISNLLSNALKFTKEGSVELGCNIKPGNLTFYVKDTGIGIDEPFFDKIFDRFRQAELEINRQYEGNGLGLAITKGFVELLGGEIWLESEIGKGSVFYFNIKLNVFKSKEKIHQISIYDEGNKKDSDQKILIVDDDSESCFYLKEILAKYTGYNTVILNSGLEAIDYVERNNDINIILLDIKMPELDGYQTASKIKSIKPGIILIAQTAYAFYNDKQKALNVGFDDYISKPILPEDLLKLLRKYI